MIEILVWIIASFGLAATAGVLRRRAEAGRVPRGRAAWMTLALWGVLSASAAVPVAMNVAWFGSAEQAWAVAAVIVGWFATVTLVAREVAGDPARGRRRCPGCWYDMSAAPAPGLKCPECGKDARREAGLFRTRRRRGLILAGLVPLLAGVGYYGLWFVRDPQWASRLPTTVLIAASPWCDWRDQMTGELVLRLERGRTEPLPEWQAALAARLSRRVVATSDSAQRVELHAWILATLKRADASTSEAILRLVSDPDPTVSSQAATLLGQMPASDEIERTLVKLIKEGDRAMQDRAMESLLRVKRERPGGGPVPAQALIDAATLADPPRSRLACQVLGQYGPYEASRAALLAAAAYSTDAWVRASAVSALSHLYGEDAGVRGMVVRALQDRTLDDFSGALALGLLRFDERALADGRLTPATSIFSDDLVRGAMIDAANREKPGTLDWVTPRRMLMRHPCLTPADRARIRGGETAERQDPLMIDATDERNEKGR